MTSLLDELTWRGLIAESTDRDALAQHFDAGPVTFYVGFDPSAPSIQIGNFVQVIVARHLQQAGHRPLLLVGGSTGLIGDPKQAGERVLNSKDVVAGWVERLRAQLTRFLDFDGPNAARIVNNLDWTESLSTLDFLRDVGKHFPVNRMLARDVVARRLESGISYTEFSYVLLQSLDYRELFRRHGCTLQFGGSDQWGNITAGVELIRRSEGERVHAMATPLITKADGTKLGKTETGTIWVDPEMTSPYTLHQYFLNTEDSKVIDYLKVYSSRSRAEIEDLARQVSEEPWKRVAQKALADDITELVHGRDERRAAVDAAAALFGRGELTHLDAGTLDAITREVGGATIAAGELPLVTDALVAAGVVESKSAARRALSEGGAYVNNQKVTDVEQRLTRDDLLAGRYVVLRRGKKTIGTLEVAP